MSQFHCTLGSSALNLIPVATTESLHPFHARERLVARGMDSVANIVTVRVIHGQTRKKGRNRVRSGSLTMIAWELGGRVLLLGEPRSCLYQCFRQLQRLSFTCRRDLVERLDMELSWRFMWLRQAWQSRSVKVASCKHSGLQQGCAF